MRKKTYAAFIAICLILCLIPSVFMVFFRSDEAIGNETQTQWPSVTEEDGSFNYHLLDEMGSYFETHYAFRSQMITADAKVQAGLFQVSNTDSVIAGQDGWLYYNSTLSDYLGEDPLSDRGMWNLAHNLALIQNYAEAMGAKFLFMVPPNKNSLYPEYMPYYYDQSVSDTRNRDHLKEYLEEAGVAYLDLFDLFESNGETLYLKQDSHWNMKGAMMVCDSALTLLEKEHESYASASPSLTAIRKGDLSNMIYPADTSVEEDYDYGLEQAYTYISGAMSSDPVSVEDFRIETENLSAADTLLMYRDSFANTLIPVLSNAFAHGYYAKSTPYPVARDIQQYHPQYVIIELVERNLRNLAKSPAIVPAPRRNVDPAQLQVISDLITDVEQCKEDANYVCFSGNVEKWMVSEHGRIYLAISAPDGSTVLYEAFTVTGGAETAGKEKTSENDDDYGFRLYLPVSMFGTLEAAQQSSVTVYTEQ